MVYMRFEFGQRLINLLTFKAYRQQRKKAKKFKWLKDIEDSTLKALRQKVRNKEKIKVCFFVIYDSVFQYRNIFEIMSKDSFFECFILVIPDTSRGDSNMVYQLDKTYKALNAKYDNVLLAYNDGKFIDFSDKYDLFCTSNPYDSMTHEFYGIEYNTKKGILSFHCNYGFGGQLNYVIKHVLNLPTMNMTWIVFYESKYSYDMTKKICDNGGRNAVLIGYAKMDSLAKIDSKNTESKRKKIIIAPHHTAGKEFENSIIPLSNFLTFADLFLELPTLYPHIDFVFRPHPLLFINLEKFGDWDKDKIKNYLTTLKSHQNMIYQEGGEYFDTFIESSGLIHDCGSFMAEYLFTDKPCCYMLKKELPLDYTFTPFGIEILKHYYKAFSRQDILDFIDNVIVENNDIMKDSRVAFAKQNIRINYPHVSQKIINYLKNKIKG